MLYDGDGFWALAPEARGGLTALAVFSGGLVIVLVRALASTVPWGPARAVFGLCLGLAAYWTFLWLSPQLFHTYLRMMIADPPVQTAIDWPPPGPRETVDQVIAALRFAGESVADHARGAMGWLLLLGGVTAPGRGRDRREPAAEAAAPAPPEDVRMN